MRVRVRPWHPDGRATLKRGLADRGHGEARHAHQRVPKSQLPFDDIKYFTEGHAAKQGSHAGATKQQLARVSYHASNPWSTAQNGK